MRRGWHLSGLGVIVLAMLAGSCDDEPQPPVESELPLGDCDAGATCENGATCTPSSTSDLFVCPVAPEYFDTPGCEPTPHPDGAGEIVPTCCTDDDCTDGPGAGHCIYTEEVTGCCGTQGSTHCAYDECGTDGDCGDGRICLPTGSHGLEATTCVPATCHGDADCDESPGGECRLLGRGTFTALVCTYPASPCRRDEDCTSGPCGTDWCSPRWSTDGSGWDLDEGVECRENDDCLARP